MTLITLYPLQGIDITGVGSINFGQHRSEVEKLLGQPDKSSEHRRSFYRHYECRIDYDEFNSVGFIEFIYGPWPERIELSLYGIDPFKIGADNLVELLTEKNDGETEGCEAKIACTFFNISVGLWRDLTEEGAEEMIAESKANGDYEYDRADLEEELEKSRNFWTVGIGKADCYRRN